MPKHKAIEIRFQDEARIGRKNGQTGVRARRGTRPRLPADRRYKPACPSGAICPARGTGAALALPFAGTRAMQRHPGEISRRAGWHTTDKLKVPRNLTPIFLPSRPPEPNPVENLWRYPRANRISNSVLDDDAIIDIACNAWTRLMARPQTITSIGIRKWAHVGQSK